MSSGFVLNIFLFLLFLFPLYDEGVWMSTILKGLSNNHKKFYTRELRERKRGGLIAEVVDKSTCPSLLWISLLLESPLLSALDDNTFRHGLACNVYFIVLAWCRMFCLVVHRLLPTPSIISSINSWSPVCQEAILVEQTFYGKDWKSDFGVLITNGGGSLR